jgi:uncharacterized protein YcnI
VDVFGRQDGEPGKTKNRGERAQSLCDPQRNHPRIVAEKGGCGQVKPSDAPVCRGYFEGGGTIRISTPSMSSRLLYNCRNRNCAGNCVLEDGMTTMTESVKGYTRRERHWDAPLITAIAALVLLIPAVAQAHVSISPRESTAGATEKYVVRAPTEGKVATTSVELEVPDGVVVETLAVPAGWAYEVKRKDDRIVAITWQMNIKPGEFAEFGFVARNPRDKTEIVWTLRQRFADGTVTDFTRTTAGAIRPTAVTKLAPMKTQ